MGKHLNGIVKVTEKTTEAMKFMRKALTLAAGGAKNYVWLGWDRQAKIDAEDWERVGGFNWRVGERRIFAEAEIGGVSRTIYLNQLVLEAPDEVRIFHKNKDKSDCRKVNLWIKLRGTHKVRLRRERVAKKYICKPDPFQDNVEDLWDDLAFPS